MNNGQLINKCAICDCTLDFPTFRCAKPNMSLHLYIQLQSYLDIDLLIRFHLDILYMYMLRCYLHLCVRFFFMIIALTAQRSILPLYFNALLLGGILLLQETDYRRAQITCKLITVEIFSKRNDNLLSELIRYNTRYRSKKKKRVLYMSFLYTYCVINYIAMSTVLTVTSTLKYSYQI